MWNTYYQRITVFNDDKWHTYLFLGGGYEFGKIVSADISLTLPFKQMYGWHDVKDQYGTIDPPDGRYPMKLFLILKFGINFILL